MDRLETVMRGRMMKVLSEGDPDDMVDLFYHIAFSCT